MDLCVAKAGLPNLRFLARMDLCGIGAASHRSRRWVLCLPAVLIFLPLRGRPRIRRAEPTPTIRGLETEAARQIVSVAGSALSSLKVGACPSNGADCIMGAVRRDARRPTRRRCSVSSSVGNKADRSCCSAWLALASLASKKTPPITRREQGGCGRISLSRAVDDGGHRLPPLFASSTHKTPVRKRTPLLGQAPSPSRSQRY